MSFISICNFLYLFKSISFHLFLKYSSKINVFHQFSTLKLNSFISNCSNSGFCHKKTHKFLLILLEDIIYLWCWFPLIKFNISPVFSKLISSNQSKMKINFCFHLILNLFSLELIYSSKVWFHKSLNAIKNGRYSFL